MTAFWRGQPGWTAAGSPFMGGRAAYMSRGFWAYETLDKLAPSKAYGVATLPTSTGNAADISRNLIQGWLYAIPDGAKQPFQGWKFIKYCFVDSSAKMGYLTLNGPCYLKQLDEFANKMTREVMKPDNRMTPYFRAYMDVARNGTKHFPSLPVSGDYQTALTTAYADVVSGAKPARQALDEVTQTIQAQLDQVRR